MRDSAGPRTPFSQHIGRVLLGVAAATLVACAGPSTGSGSLPSDRPTSAPTDVQPSSSFPLSSPPTSATPSIDPGPTGEPPRLALVSYASGLAAPVDIAVRPGDPEALYVVERDGLIRVVRDGRLEAQPVLDIRDAVSAGGERGLLGLAFHPDPSDDRVFVYYTDRNDDQVVASFRMDRGGEARALPDSEQILLTMEDRFGNHNGGAVVFGPDGYLYISTGDGGGGGDPLDSGRRLDTLLAKILRIDIDRPGPDGMPYSVPADNPFVGDPGARPEIWHTGLRNPWRIQFDRLTGDLWIGDVGQSAWEEIDRSSSGVGGLDFGWNRMEGLHCYPPGQDDCRTPDLTLPIAEYGHDLGCSVAGGTVYRGTQQPALQGWYVFADYCSGRVWVLDATATTPAEPRLALDSDHSISAIVEDADGELYATDIRTGELLHIEIAPD